VRTGAALDQFIVGQAVEQAGERDRLQVENFGEFRLLEALRAVDSNQHRPLRARNTELTRPLIGISLDHSGYVHDRKGEFSIHRLRGHGKLSK
jgi:hypothetical protein